MELVSHTPIWSSSKRQDKRKDTELACYLSILVWGYGAIFALFHLNNWFAYLRGCSQIVWAAPGDKFNQNHHMNQIVTGFGG